MNKVLLILPTWNAGLFFHHGLQYVSATMARQGIEHDIIMLDEPDCLPVMLELLDNDYDTVAATSTSCEFEKLNNLIGELKEFENDDKTYLLGGAHATITNDKGNFTDICVGEYGGYADNLDDLPDYLDGKMPLQEILDAKKGWLSVIVSRGCPYRCAYCVNSLNPQSVRRMSVEKAIQHISSIVRSLKGVKYINLDDDNLATDKFWLGEFLNMYKVAINIPYVINIRAVDLTDEVANLLQDTGCHEVQIGVECGNETTRRIILNKKISNETLCRAFDNCNRRGIRSLAYIMHGLPFTNGASVIETANLIKRLKPTLVRDTYLYPFEGTAIRNTCIKAGCQISGYNDNYYDVSCFTGEDSEKQRFRRELEGHYKVCERNNNYLEKKA